MNRHQLLEEIWLCGEEAFRHSGGLHHSRPTFTKNMRVYSGFNADSNPGQTLMSQKVVLFHEKYI
jgi:hypothetical protein